MLALLYSRGSQITLSLWDVSPKTILVPETKNYFPSYILSVAFCSQIVFSSVHTTLLLSLLWQDYNCFETCFSLLLADLRATEETVCVRVHACVFTRDRMTKGGCITQVLPVNPILSLPSSWVLCMQPRRLSFLHFLCSGSLYCISRT